VPTIATSVPRGGFAFPTQRLFRELHHNSEPGGRVAPFLVATNRINRHGEHGPTFPRGPRARSEEPPEPGR
jgi:hypothetical protein